MQSFDLTHEGGIMIDDDGMWYMHVGKKQGLVPWSRVAGIRERLLRPYLDVVDFDDNIIFRIGYDQGNFKNVMHTMIENINLFNIDSRSVTYSRGFRYLFLYFLTALSLSGFNMFYYGDKLSLLASALFTFLAFILVYIIFYTFMPKNIKISNNNLIFRYFIRKRTIPGKDIISVEIYPWRHAAHGSALQLRIKIRNGKTVGVPDMDVDKLQIAFAIRKLIAHARQFTKNTKKSNRKNLNSKQNPESLLSEHLVKIKERATAAERETLNFVCASCGHTQEIPSKLATFNCPKCNTPIEHRSEDLDNTPPVQFLTETDDRK